MTPEEWKSRWPNFQPHEVMSPNALEEIPHVLCPHSMDLLQKLRNEIQLRIIVNFGEHTNRGLRTYSDNIYVGGTKNSMHTHGRSFDMHSPDMTIADLFQYVVNMEGFNGIGKYPRFIHADTRLTTKTGEKTIWVRK